MRALEPFPASAGVFRRAPQSRFDEFVRRVLDFDLSAFPRGNTLAVRAGTVDHEPIGLGAGILSLINIADVLCDAPDGSSVIIDEPEQSLHPDYQARLLELLMEESERIQIIYATHSPYMFNWDAILNGGILARVVWRQGSYARRRCAVG